MSDTMMAVLMVISFVISMLVIALPIVLLVNMFKKSPVTFCTACGHEGPGKKVTRGSILIEIILWLCLLIPGLIYSIWRMGSRHAACPSCGSTALVPPTSPVATQMKANLGISPQKA